MKTEQNIGRTGLKAGNDHIQYGIIKEEYFVGGGCRTTYGIVAYEDDKCSAPTVIAAVHDVTVNDQAISDLVSLCDFLKLSSIHIGEVVDDFLVSRQLTQNKIRQRIKRLCLIFYKTVILPFELFLKARTGFCPRQDIYLMKQ